MASRLSPPWHPLEAVPVGLASLATAVLASLLLAQLVGGVGGVFLPLSGMALGLALLGWTLLWVAIRHRGALGALRPHSGRLPQDIAVGGWSGAALFGLTLLVVLPTIVWLWRLFTGHAPPPPDQRIIPDDPGVLEITLGMIAAVLIAPAGEEVFFRGFLFGGLRTRFSFAASAALSAIVFAGVHGQTILFLALLPFGFAQAYLYERRGSLTTCIAAHAVFNVIGYTLIVMART